MTKEKTGAIIRWIIFILSLSGIVGLLFKCTSVLSWISIIAVDLYLLAVLIVSAVASDRKNQTSKGETNILPGRKIGLLFIAFFTASIIASFAEIYFNIGYNALHSEKPNPFTQRLDSRTDAAYFSFVTTLTVGYGEITPTTHPTRLIIIFQLISSGILFFGAFPFLISRISTYKSAPAEPSDPFKIFEASVQSAITELKTAKADPTVTFSKSVQAAVDNLRQSIES